MLTQGQLSGQKVELTPSALELSHAGSMKDSVDEQPVVTNHHALVSVYEEGRCLERSELIIKVVVQSMDIDVTYKVNVPKDMVSPERLWYLSQEAAVAESSKEV